ncbi:MAG: glucose 1-dehydrogenase [Ktedonobacterales bacterium]|nr:glucose 1-dehydrogenase [Ktedonobacterales bacterium]
MLLGGKIAIVTGADSGIGRGIAVALTQAGAAVMINYHRNVERANTVLAEITGAGGKAQIMQGDVSVLAELNALVTATVAAFGRLDIMVNNAGFESHTSILDSSEDDFNSVIAVNLKGAFFGTQLAARQMINQGGGGRIINISSIHEDWPMPGNTPYSVSKGGIRMLTRTAGVELAPHGITVVGVGPGAVNTPINAATLADPAKKAALEGAIPTGRIAEPQDIADLVVWLASDQSRNVTATTFISDGGMTQYSAGL